MKLLSPAGNFECLKMAVFNGADEVYLGINEFNARNNIDGFTLETLETAVDFAHLYGVKVHLAINILFSDEELQSAFDTVVKAYNMGVDAFIVQDLALAHILHVNYPQIELHASTQMGIHNLEGVLAIEKSGFSRVVLARETPLEEIKRIKQNTNIEIEYFAHGALCVSFSGNCYMSSYLFGASGNRGRCKQLCRLPFALKKERVEKLIAKGAEQKRKYIEGFLGKTLEIVPENCYDGFTEGYSENYIRIYVEGEMEKRPTHVRVERFFKDGVLAKIIED
jgi:putative protease